MRGLLALLVLAGCQADNPAASRPAPAEQWDAPYWMARGAQVGTFATVPGLPGHSLTVVLELASDSIYTFRDEDETAERFPAAEALLRAAAAQRKAKR